MESTRPELIEASGNKYNHQVSERGNRRPKLEDASSSRHHPSQPSPEQMSDGFYKFYEPDSAHAATLDIFFFHGLECEGSNLQDAHISSWRSTSEQEEETARLHEAFSELWRARTYRCTIFGLGEVESTPGSRRGRLHVREASSRFGDNYMTISSDHFSICKPSDKNSNKYKHLKDLIEDVQERVELERSQSLMVPKVTVGVDGLVTEVLGKHLRENRFVGFFGLGGVGKTTVAKIIFNKVCAKFEFTCFVEEIKLISGTKEEIKKKVWEKMCHHGRPVQSSRESSRDGWYQVVGKSMFLVFDDIEDHRHADLLQEIADINGMGESRFLLTSRDTQRLRGCEDDVHIIPLDHLDDQDAKKLFTTYAFPNQEPPKSFEGVIQEIVVGCGGLPLTLEVLGKYLRSEPKEEVWAEIPIALRKCEDIADLEQRVWAKLKLSYDKLPGDEVKNMFLDIACFFDHYDLSPFFRAWSANDAMKAWSVTYTSAHNRVKLLEERSLLKVSRSKNYEGFDYMEFHFHEHVRRMGQRIAQQEGRSYNLPRFSLPSDDYPYDDQIISQEGKELGKIVAHNIDFSANSRGVFAQDCAFCIMRQVWPKLTAIQYMTLTVDVKNCCNQCRNQTVALPSTLLLLYLSLRHTYVVTGRNSVHHMSGTLSFATCASLVRLKLWNCKNFGDLSELQQLRILEIADCSEAGNWATSLGELKSLERLRLTTIEEPFELLLPISFGRLTGLQYLSIWECKVTSIPASFRNLTSLQFLDVERIIGRQVIPIGSFRQLRVLDLTCWAIADLADLFRELTALEDLALHCEGISELPATLGNLTLLKELSVKCPVKVLPDSLGNLTNLERLELKYPIQSLPASFPNLTRLVTLALHCEHAGTKVTVQNWDSWETDNALEIWVKGHDAVPDVLRHLQWHLTKVKVFKLQCEHGATAVVVRNMINLVTLEIAVTGQQAVPDIIRNLQKLRRLKLSCSAVENNLVESFTGMSSLEDIQLKGICNLQALSGMIGQLSHLQSLSLSHLTNLYVIPESLGNIYSLQELKVKDCPIESLAESLGQLSSLRRLKTRRCKNLKKFCASVTY
ncbi:hypothetical protein R1flu_003702 [Riccia fluitans]|uniref:NB-ARC domain-containing protein n=1 Tax=Riccia fluitans TaxID=41844 RepID=A0ABD1YCS8_9MARC